MKRSCEESDEAVKKQKATIINPLPCEISAMIFDKLDFVDVFKISQQSLNDRYDPLIHTHEFAIRNNDLLMFEWLVNKNPPSDIRKLQDLAIVFGSLEILKYLEIMETSHVSGKVILNCIENGHLDVVKYLLFEKKCYTYVDLYHGLKTAILFKRNDIAEWIVTTYDKKRICKYC